MSNVQAYMSRIGEWWSAARGNKLFWRGLAGAALIIVLDQASKFWIVHGLDLPGVRKIEISGVFDLSYVENRGASFGMLSGMRWLLSLISIGVALALTAWLGRLTRTIAATGVAFVIGGALGNLYDRLAYGYVIDFLDFSGLYFPWVFNVADMAINVGIAFLLLDAWQTRDQSGAK
ncbi:signal peptidase II [Hyphococcus flavus]|uniref:Lipoprotein signal peptidase n=1 Tax=Hyphococcus flavus TaxID=1866326 RepID=A0AAE9ZGH9_9PROT|nr:signal peptidase II [Hyphococcus flavus]WDI32553.1 signal peptidase II [Hyphococcus flavus]